VFSSQEKHVSTQIRLKDRYELQEPVGSGAMGDVFRALDMQTNQWVAVKALKSEILAHGPDMLTRFIREGEALRQLNHPNIVKLLDTVQQEGTHYLVMEYVPGGDLRQLVTEFPDGLPLNRALVIALDLADALTRAHRLSIIHRDLKPANILVADDGTPRLSDFGIAHFGDSSAITESGALVGTFAYLSPEACMSLPLDERADIWAFGVVLYEILTGQRPFEGASPAAIMMSIMQEKTPDLQRARPEISDQLNDLLYRMLEKNREARIPSIRLVGAELETIIKGVPAASSPAFKSAAVLSKSSIFSTPTPAATAHPHNLPAQTTPFVGREHELSELTRLLQEPANRLVTILAPGGMGKTRLSLEAAEKILNASPSYVSGAALFLNGAYFVSLAPLSVPENIVPAIAEAVNFQFYPGGEPKQELLDFFHEKNLLLILDNFEHLLGGAELVADILAAAPGVKVLATSRERLNLSGETIFNLEGMAFPDWETPQDALEYSAVKLFMQSAKRVRPDFELDAKDLRYVARICRLVEGMPLGILLAAAWVEMLSPQEIADEIARSLDFLESQQRDTPTRQRSIRAVFDYSWNLLNENERAVFQKLSIFRGGFTREAAQIVAGANLHVLMALVSKSLLRRDVSSGRYEVHELLRQYAEQRLEQSGYADAVYGAHSSYYADFLSQRYAAMWSRTQKQVMAEIMGEIENLQSAWNWAVEHRQLDTINRAMNALALTYELLSQYREGNAIFREANTRLSPAHDQQTALLLARLRVIYGWMAGRVGDYDTMRITAEESLPLFHQLNSKSDIGPVLRNLSHAAIAQGRYEAAHQYALEALALARELDDKPAVYLTIAGMAWGSFLAGRYDEARQMLQQELNAVDVFGVPEIMNAYRQNLGAVLHALNEQQEAKRLFEEALSIAKDLGNRRAVAFILTNLGNIAHSMGRYEAAQHHYEESLVTFQDIGDRSGAAEALNALGGGYWSLGDYPQARHSHQGALTIYREIGDIRGVANSLALLATDCGAVGDYIEGRVYLEECLALRRQMGNTTEIIDALAHLARMETLLGNYETATRWNEQILEFRQQADTIPPAFFWGQYKGTQITIFLAMGNFQKARQTIEELTSMLSIDHMPRFIQAVAKNGLGWSQRELGGLIEAERNLHESLAIGMEMHSPPLQINSIIQLAALVGTRGHPQRAVELLTFARANPYTEYAMKRLTDQYLEPLQAALSPGEFDAAIERGNHLDLDTIVRQILDTD
jgi:serine/threonine protein kinase/tetratricopeptide (TPR) repeat protein